MYVPSENERSRYVTCSNCQNTYRSIDSCPICKELNYKYNVNFNDNSKTTSFYAGKCVLQSDAEYKTDEAKSDIHTLNQSIDEQQGVMVTHESPLVELSKHLFAPDATLERFLTRPVLIKTITWSEGGGVDTYFNPWYDYLNSAVIKNKIQNYYMGRMNLHLKVMVNASPFYYGACLFAYQPLSGYNPCKLQPTDSTYPVGLSQRPNIWIYPQTSQAGEMTLPFIYPYDAVDLTSSTTVQDLGRIDVKSVTLLRNANSVAGTGATIRVYAYASEVLLGGPTYKAVLQSNDEYGDGPVSGPASAVSNIARRLSDVPIIGPFAKATSIGAGAVSSIAKIFGFTDVPVIDNSEPMKNMPFHSVTSAHISEPVTKLCLDPKNEVSIDTSIIGVKTDDELTISKFVDRYTYMGTATWAASDTTDSLLWSHRIQPNQFVVSSAASGPYGNKPVQATPSGHLCSLFQYWRGSMTVKITAIASKFHRGRYVITWDPVANISSNTSYIGTSFTKIVDIAEESEIEVDIPYSQPYPFCKSTPYPEDMTQPCGTSYLSHVDRFDNGILTIRVFTQQTSPVASADIYLLVSVKAGKDLEYALPRSLSLQVSPFAYQSGVTMDTKTSVNITNSELTVDKKRYLVSFGEPVLSLRSLLRRAVLTHCDTIPYPTTASTTLLTYRGIRSCFPLSPGFDPNGVHTANKAVSGSAPYNFVNYNPLAYIAQCFVAQRGSIIHHVNMHSGTTADGYLACAYSQAPRSAGNWNGSGSVTTANSINQCTNTTLINLDPGSSGTDITNGFVMPSMSVQIPHNTPSKFFLTTPTTTVLGSSFDYSDIHTFKVQFNTRDASLAQIVDYIQIGTDYSLGMFLNVPLMYVATSPVVPTP